MNTLTELSQKTIAAFSQLPIHLENEFKDNVIESCQKCLSYSEQFMYAIDLSQDEMVFKHISSILSASSVFIFGRKRMSLIKEIISKLGNEMLIPNDMVEEIETYVNPRTDAANGLHFQKVKVLISFCSSPKFHNISQELFDALLSFIEHIPPPREGVKRINFLIEKDENLKDIDPNELFHTLTSVFIRCSSSNHYNELGVVWYRYVGGIIDSSRPFCKHREGDIFHYEEIKAWGRGENAGDINDIQNGTWEGKIEITDEETIFNFLGGWGCRHSIVPVGRRRVPEEVIERVKGLGYET